MMRIDLFQTNRLPSALRRQTAGFRRACRLALGAKAKISGELNLIFTTNPEIKKINKKFLGHDYFTDVVAFPYKRGPGAAAFGDIYISADQARIQARDLGHSLMDELLTLAIHGTLHLIGYDDHAPADRKRMFARQDQVLKKLKARQ